MNEPLSNRKEIVRRNGKSARVFRGGEGCCGSGKLRQGSKRIDGKWRLVGVDVCSGGQAIKEWKRTGENRVHKLGVSQSKSGGWGRHKETEGERK